MLPARTVLTCSRGAATRQRSIRVGMKCSSPTSVIASVKRRSLVSGSKPPRRFRARVTWASALPTGSAKPSAKGVGCMPCPVRTNSSSPNSRRRRARALLTADCVNPRRRAAPEIWRSR